MPADGPPGSLSHADYQPGTFWYAAMPAEEQAALRQRLRRHHRYLHGWGVVCGYLVLPAQDPTRPWGLRVCPGYAIGPRYDEILLRTPAVIDVRDWLWSRLDAAREAYVGIRAADEDARSEWASPPECGCPDPELRATRLRDVCRIEILWPPVAPPRPAPVDLCDRPLVACPECPDSPYLILARVMLPENEFTPIDAGAIGPP